MTHKQQHTATRVRRVPGHRHRAVRTLPAPTILALVEQYEALADLIVTEDDVQAAATEERIRALLADLGITIDEDGHAVPAA